MRQKRFEEGEGPLWQEYRDLLTKLDGGKRPGHAVPDGDLARFPTLYRRVCAHYALARSRGYSPGLTGELHELVRRGYRSIYRRRFHPIRPLLGFMAKTFPRTLRRHARLFWLAVALLLAPMLAMGIAVYADAELVYSLMSGEQVAELEAMYDPTSDHPGRGPERQADTDFAMFGFYILNNVGIGFRCFAGGLALGLGSALILLFNGLHIGAAAGHLTRLGYDQIFWPFVSGHGPYELTAIAISGASGLLLGKALLAPGNRTRLAALQSSAREAVVLVGGAAFMLLLAAVVEAFWSAGGAPAAIKYGVGLLGWLLVALYLALAGREGSTGP